MPFIEDLLVELQMGGKKALKTVVFARTREEVRNLWAFFRYHLPEAKKNLIDMYMSVTEEPIKKYIATEFTKPNSKIRLLVATSAFGLGVDCRGLKRVVHWTLPTVFDDFVQQVGRAGRDGRLAISIVFTDGTHQGLDEAMREYLTTGDCRKEVISRFYDHAITDCHPTCCNNFHLP